MSIPLRDRSKSAFCAHCIRRGIIILVLLLAIGGGYFYWAHRDHNPRTEAAAPPQGPMPVAVVVAEPETVPVRRRYLGQTESSLVVEIRARVAGYLEERNFTEGEHVTKGQKLYQIDQRPFQVDRDKARAQLARSQASLERARNQLKRYADLASRQSVSPDELEQWRTEEAVSAADVELQKSQIAAAELQLSYTTIESPVSGIIGKALKDKGSYVDAGQNGLVAVVQQIDPIYVRFSVTESDQLRWQQQLATKQVTAPSPDKQELQLTLADGTVYPYDAKVNFIDVQVDQNTGTSIVRGTVPNPKDLLRPGQFIYAVPLGIQRVGVFRVPQSAVQQSPAGATVFVINDKGLAEARPVTLGEWSGEDGWIIEKGLKEGDKVITDHLMTLRPGTPVAAAAAPATAAARDTTRPAPENDGKATAEGRQP